MQSLELSGLLVLSSKKVLNLLTELLHQKT